MAQPDTPSFQLPSWSRDELEVLSELQEGHLFIDETFAPNSHALGRDSDKALAIGWARMHEALPGAALFVGGAPPGDLVAGPNVAGNGIDDAWFAGALATVATLLHARRDAIRGVHAPLHAPGGGCVRSRPHRPGRGPTRRLGARGGLSGLAAARPLPQPLARGAPPLQGRRCVRHV